jgi:hypothetical protein
VRTVAGEDLAQLGQRHLRPTLREQLVEAQPATTIAARAGDLQQGQPPERAKFDGCRHSSLQRRLLWVRGDAAKPLFHCDRHVFEAEVVVALPARTCGTEVQ